MGIFSKMGKLKQRIESSALVERIYLIFLGSIPFICMGITAFGIYKYQSIFKGDLSEDHGRWGDFGDFVSGISSPVLGIFTLVVVVLTFYYQRKSHKLTSETLEKTLKDSRASAKSSHSALEMQQKQLELALFQTKSEEFERTIRFIHEGLIELINKEEYTLLTDLDFDFELDTFPTLFKRYQHLNIEHLLPVSAQYDDSIEPMEVIKKVHRFYFREVEKSLNNLKEYMEMYKKLHDDGKFEKEMPTPFLDNIKIYWSEYAAALGRWLAIEENTASYFKV